MEVQGTCLPSPGSHGSCLLGEGGQNQPQVLEGEVQNHHLVLEAEVQSLLLAAEEVPHPLDLVVEDEILFLHLAVGGQSHQHHLVEEA